MVRVECLGAVTCAGIGRSMLPSKGLRADNQFGKRKGATASMLLLVMNCKAMKSGQITIYQTLIVSRHRKKATSITKPKHSEGR
jgi:hypothetical protein